MSDADQARGVRALVNIEHSLKELVKVMATLNSNFVAFVDKFSEAEVTVEKSWDANQLTTDDVNKEG